MATRESGWPVCISRRNTLRKELLRNVLCEELLERSPAIEVPRESAFFEIHFTDERFGLMTEDNLPTLP